MSEGLFRFGVVTTDGMMRQATGQCKRFGQVGQLYWLHVEWQSHPGTLASTISTPKDRAFL